MTTRKLKAPFPYFGGKSRVADKVWDALGNVNRYYEPFFGSGAVLLSRPNFDQGSHYECVCEINGLLANAWRSIKHDPEKVIEFCDWPVSHVDLQARIKHMHEQKDSLTNSLKNDPSFCDAKIGSYFIYCMSIASAAEALRSNSRAIPKLHRRLGVVGRIDIPKEIDALFCRLKRVAICCGDWSRICGTSIDKMGGVVGIFFDPPYSANLIDKEIYGKEIDWTVADRVREWCISYGQRDDFRIVLAGYDEHDSLADHGWRCEKWKAHGGLSNIAKGGRSINHMRETLWYSPHCLREKGLFDC